MSKKLALAWLAAGLCAAQTPAPGTGPEERLAHWREDLNMVVSTLSAKGSTVDLQRGISTRGQKDFERLYPNLKTDLDALAERVPSLSDSEVVLGLMKAIASARIAHNTVSMPIAMGFFGRLPLRFSWFADGLAIVEASHEYASALGTRVVKFGDKTTAEAVAGLAPYIAHENDVWLRAQSVEFLRPRAMLQHLGVLNDAQVTLTLEKPGGEQFTLAVRPVDPRTKMVSVADALHLPTPLFRTQPAASYWHQYLEDSGTLFVQYNRCWNDPKMPFPDFAAKVLTDADARPVKRVVIDLRWNGGGDSRVIGPLVGGLASRAKKAGAVYALIGAGTFSSAILNAQELRQKLHARLVGEPTGGMPSSYGEVKSVTLPHSQLRVQYTTKWFGSKKASEPQSLTPDIPAPRTLADALAGRDPVLEAAIRAK